MRLRVADDVGADPRGGKRSFWAVLVPLERPNSPSVAIAPERLTSHLPVHLAPNAARQPPATGGGVIRADDAPAPRLQCPSLDQGVCPTGARHGRNQGLE